MYREYFKWITYLIIVFGLLYLIFGLISDLEGDVGSNSYKCAISPFNKYSNSTQASYLFGKCYVTVYNFYDTTRTCTGGFLGIGESCTESDKSHSVMYSGEVCFKLKTGERC